MIGFYVPNFELTPEAIFSNNIVAFDVNFFNPKKNVTKTASTDVTGEEEKQKKEFKEMIDQIDGIIVSVDNKSLIRCSKLPKKSDGKIDRDKVNKAYDVVVKYLNNIPDEVKKLTPDYDSLVSDLKKRNFLNENMMKNISKEEDMEKIYTERREF